MPAKLERCVKDLIGQGKSKDSAYAICTDAMKKSEVIIDKEQDKLFLKSFLMDASLNKNLWGVNPDTLDENIKTYIGKPLVITEKLDHPEMDGEPNFDHQLIYQDKFRIGTILDVTNKDGIYSAVIEVTDPHAQEAFKLGNLPTYVSPSLFHDGVLTEADDDTKTWRGLHLAVVDEPAFGAIKAKITGQCTGKSDVCLAQLKRAKCDFCIKRTIQNYKDKVATNNKSSPNSSHINKKNKKGIMSEQVTEDKPKFSEEDFNKLKQTIELKETEIKTLKEANEKLSSDNTSALERIGKIEAEARNTKIGSILEGCYFKDDESRKALHDIYVKSGLTYEEVEQATDGLRHIKSGKTTETRLPVKNAKSTNEEPYWISDYKAVTGGVL